MNTTESNKLIAEFMELPAIRHHESNRENMYSWLNEINGETILLPPSKMNYERSWDWLMPTLKKISGILYSGYAASVSEQFKMINSPTNYPIENVYEQAVEFIQWYNKNK